MRAVATSTTLDTLSVSEQCGPSLREQLDGAPTKRSGAIPSVCMICGCWYDALGDTGQGCHEWPEGWHPATVRCRDCAHPTIPREEQAA